MINEFVSIIIPTYNRAFCIEQCIKSVLNQTYPYFELLIIDDGSTDNTKEIVKSIPDNRIRYMYKSNGGAADARNFGIKEAQYDYIAFQDSDDLWHPDKLEKQINYILSNPKLSFVYHKISYNVDNLGLIEIPQNYIPKENLSGDIYSQLLWNNLVACPSILARKDCLIQAGLFDTNLKALEDYDLVLRLSKENQVGYIDKILIDINISEGSVSQNYKNHLISSCVILGKYLNDYISTNNFEHRVERIYTDSKNAGIDHLIIPFLERIIILKMT